MNGRSRPNSHRALLPVLQLRQAFPKMQQWEGRDLVAKIRAKDGNPLVQHPCMTTWGTYVNCLRRYPTSKEERCAVEAKLHVRCLRENEFWKAVEPTPYQKTLEALRIFNETARFRYPKEPLRCVAAGTVLEFHRRTSIPKLKVIADGLRGDGDGGVGNAAGNSSDKKTSRRR